MGKIMKIIYYDHSKEDDGNVCSTTNIELIQCLDQCYTESTNKDRGLTLQLILFLWPIEG